MMLHWKIHVVHLNFRNNIYDLGIIIVSNDAMWFGSRSHSCVISDAMLCLNKWRSRKGRSWNTLWAIITDFDSRGSDCQRLAELLIHSFILVALFCSVLFWFDFPSVYEFSLARHDNEYWTERKATIFVIWYKNHWLFNCNTACIKMNPSSVQGRTIFIYLSFHGGLIYVTFHLRRG